MSDKPYKYFISYFMSEANGTQSWGAAQVSLDKKIEGMEEIAQMQDDFKRNNEGSPDILITNWKLF